MTQTYSTQDLQFEWLQSAENIPALVALFLKTAEKSYISHSEIIEGRASDVGRWSDDIETVLYNDFQASIIAQNAPDMSQSNGALCLMREKGGTGEIVGFANLYFVVRGSRKLCILADIVIDPAKQGHGFGQALYGFVEQFCVSNSVGQLHLESGLNNHAAHRFFENQGFELISKNFMKRLRHR